MTITRIHRFRAKSGMEEALHNLLLSAIPAIAEASDCLKVRLLSSLDDPADFLIYEEWTSIEAHKAAAMNLSGDTISQIASLVAETPRGDYYAG